MDQRTYTKEIFSPLKKKIDTKKMQINDCEMTTLSTDVYKFKANEKPHLIHHRNSGKCL